MKTNWQTKKLGQLCDISSGNSAPQAKDCFTDGVFPFFRTSDVGSVHIDHNLCKTRDYLNKKGISKMTLYKKGTILFPKSGASTFLNHRVMMGCDGYVSSHLATIKAKEELDDMFLYYFLITIDAKTITANSNYPSLKISDISKIDIDFPSLQTQKEIVKILDSNFEKLNKLKTIREESILETEKILLQTLNEIFENGKKNGWKEEKIGDIFIFNYGKGISRSDRSKNGKYSVYGANGELGKTDKFLIDGESIIIGRKGSAGEITRVSEKFWPTDVTYFVVEDNKYDIDFAFYLFKYLDFTQYAKGVKPGINRNEIYSLKFYFPPILEQKKIISKLDILSEKLKKLTEIQKSQIDDFKQLEKAYLREAFNGELI